MSAPVIIAKHPLHPMLIVFPIGLWVFSLSVVGILLLAAAGWLGGEMVYVQGMGVQQPKAEAKAKKGARSETAIGAQNRSR